MSGGESLNGILLSRMYTSLTLSRLAALAPLMGQRRVILSIKGGGYHVKRKNFHLKVLSLSDFNSKTPFIKEE
jgi:hypothetical protein